MHAATGPGGQAARTDVNVGGQVDGLMGTRRDRLLIYSIVSVKQEGRRRAGAEEQERGRVREGAVTWFGAGINGRA